MSETRMTDTELHEWLDAKLYVSAHHEAGHVSGKMDAMSGEAKKTLKWVTAGASRDMSYTENGYQYVIRSGDKEYTLLQKTRSEEISRRQVCATKQQAYELAERWAAEAVLSR